MEKCPAAAVGGQAEKHEKDYGGSGSARGT